MSTTASPFLETSVPDAHSRWRRTAVGGPRFTNAQISDTLFVESEVLEKKESRSKPDRGTVKVHTRVLNQDGVLVAEFKRLVLVPRKSPGEAPEAAEGNVE